ncbi:ATP-binding cassette domain-containing protein [Gordonia desulfuricans]|uniref:ATP-binding cassette domain-containing protein n=1 Tax=Gordonia desulfuricans TaxID=89051 RepID=A0A7K3LP35_9ACTN|nr:ATP-binding cassette domain-containing protein [Gordonia desulfuricans]NDK89801.1 ATP-binding cassette domain-containing protein [Gordonia desulfuricans]
MTGIELRAVTRRFGHQVALCDVDLAVRAGRVHALVGENGAGKSTALKILSGAEHPDAGSVLIDAGPVRLRHRRDGIDHGIGTVMQQLSLIGDLTLAENHILAGDRFRADRGRAARELTGVAERAGLRIPVDTPVAELELAQRQQGELAMALARGARILLLDEPTSALGPHETEALFDTIRTLADSGTAVLLITHRIDEVRAVADDVTVLTRGRVTLSGAMTDISDERLVAAMIGEQDDRTEPVRTVAPRTALVLSLTEVGTAGSKGLAGVDITVHAGEIVGVVGVGGNGQRILAEVAAGLVTPTTGSVRVADRPLTGDAARRETVSYVPEERDEALLPDADAAHSAILRTLGRGGFRTRVRTLDWPAIRTFTDTLMRRHDVRPASSTVRVGALSGGNRQKLVVGRELDANPVVAVLHGPTQGLDPRAAVAIRAEIRAAADRGTGILLISADIDEVRELADHILVISRGRIVDEFDIGQYSPTRVGRAMAGVTEGAA